MTALILAAAFYLPPNPTVSPLWNDWHGGFWNIGKGNEQADTNALAHLYLGVACPLVGYYIGDKSGDAKRGALIGALVCTGLVAGRLFLVHAPQKVSPGYGAELRAGLVTGVGSIWAVAIPILLF
jgi:VIT1/CCC1 family predicted Fe2+/Mn2+ transporter